MSLLLLRPSKLLVLSLSSEVSSVVSSKLCSELLLLFELESLLLLLLLLMRIFSHQGGSGSGGGGGGFSGVISMQILMHARLLTRCRKGAPMFCSCAVPVYRKKKTAVDVVSISAHI